MNVKSRKKSGGSFDDERLAVSVPEAGRLLGLGRGSAYQAAQTGALPTLRINGRLIVPKVALRALLAKAGNSVA